MHAIGIDVILLGLLSGDRDLVYSGCVFQLHAGLKQAARELFMSMATTTSDYLIALLFSQWLKRDIRSASQTLLDIFIATADFKREAHSLGTLKPFFTGSLLQIPHEFLIEFDLLLDLKALAAAGVPIFYIGRWLPVKNVAGDSRTIVAV
jgi:hypothetical protein